jgi:hypothetical protein
MPKWEDMSEPAREALRAHQYKPGESGNPEGVNGWSKLRERYRERLELDVDGLTNVLIKLAQDGDVMALRLALGPILDIKSLELSGTDGAPLNFAELVAKANAPPAEKETA